MIENYYTLAVLGYGNIEKNMNLMCSFDIAMIYLVIELITFEHLDLAAVICLLSNNPSENINNRVELAHTSGLVVDIAKRRIMSVNHFSRGLIKIGNHEIEFVDSFSISEAL